MKDAVLRGVVEIAVMENVKNLDKAELDKVIRLDMGRHVWLVNKASIDKLPVDVWKIFCDTLEKHYSKKRRDNGS